MTYLALTRMKAEPEKEWDVIGEGPQAMDAAKMLRNQMTECGFYHADLYELCVDLVNGYILTADDGRQFKVEQKPLGREIVEGPKAEVKDPLLDLLDSNPWDPKPKSVYGVRWEDTLTPLQRELWQAADKLMEVLEKVPTTAHYAVNEALRAVAQLRDKADTVEMGG